MCQEPFPARDDEHPGADNPAGSLLAYNTSGHKSAPLAIFRRDETILRTLTPAYSASRALKPAWSK